jgi:hypothetical protein
LLEAFAESLMGTRESIKNEVREEVRGEVEQEVLKYTPFENFSDLTEWLYAMNELGIVGKYEEEITERAVEGLLEYTDYSSIDEMTSRIEELENAMSEIRDLADI